MMRSLLVERRLVGRCIRLECSSSDPCIRSIVFASSLAVKESDKNNKYCCNARSAKDPSRGSKAHLRAMLCGGKRVWR